MINGVMHFQYSQYGWMLTQFYDGGLVNWNRDIKTIGNILRISGNFTHKPKHGFVIRPHKLMVKG